MVNYPPPNSFVLPSTEDTSLVCLHPLPVLIVNMIFPIKRLHVIHLGILPWYSRQGICFYIELTTPVEDFEVVVS